MPRRANMTLATAGGGGAIFVGGGTSYVVQTPAGVLYLVYVDVNADVYYKKSTDGGLSWAAPVAVFAGTVTALSVWYDRWSDIAAGLIHIAYTESVTDDTLYRTINTESSDALSTQTVIFAGTSTLAGGCLSICRARGGNVYCATMTDAGTEGGFFRLPNANVPNGAWDAARATVFEAVTNDQVILVPGWAADNQDMMAFFWDASADEISRKLYDDSANSWAETSIATSMVDAAATAHFPHFAATVDISNSRNLLSAWSAVDLLNADLPFWHVTESAITGVTNVVTNSTDDQGLVAIGIATDTGWWYAFYGGASDGSETFNTSINIYQKISKDSGSTWGPESKVSLIAEAIEWIVTCPRFTGPCMYANYLDYAVDEMKMNVSIAQPVARSMIGL